MREALRIEPLAARCGAEIHGVDIAGCVDETLLRRLREALARFGVIVLRGQVLSPEQHLAFAERWGPVNVNRFFPRVPGHPSIAEVRKEPDDERNIGNDWHTDHSYDQVPALGSMLLAREVPDSGGDTLFASMYAACDDLSDGLRETLKRLRAVHSSRHVFGAEAARDDPATRFANPELATQDAVHPVLIRHPDSGRAALYVNPVFTVRFDGWSVEESRGLLDYLYAQGARAEHQCRVRWQPDTLAIWDNRATWHRAPNDYPGQRRVMHRITLEGVALPGI